MERHLHKKDGPLFSTSLILSLTFLMIASIQKKDKANDFSLVQNLGLHCLHPNIMIRKRDEETAYYSCYHYKD